MLAAPPPPAAAAVAHRRSTHVVLALAALALAVARPLALAAWLGVVGCAAAAALVLGAALAAVSALDATLGGGLAGGLRLVVRGHLRVRGVTSLLLSRTPTLAVDLCLAPAAGGGRVAGVDSIVVGESGAALAWAALAGFVTGTPRRAPVAVAVDGPFVDWTHGDDGCLRLAALLMSVGLLRDARPPGPADAAGARHARPAAVAGATTAAVVPLALSGVADVSGLAPLRVTITRGRLLLPEIVGRALGGSLTVSAAAGDAALAKAAAAAVSAAAGDAALAKAAAADGTPPWWRARSPPPSAGPAVPLELTMTSDAARVNVRGWRTGTGLALARPVVARAALSDDLARLLLARLHPFLAAVVQVSAEGGGAVADDDGGGKGGGGKGAPALVDPATLAAAPPPPAPARVALWPAGGALPSPSLDIVLSPVTVAVQPVGVAASLLSSLSLLSLGAGPASARAGRLALSTGTARVTLARGGTARARRLDVRLGAPGGRAVTLAVWATADAKNPDALDARVGVPVAALRAGGAAARALAPPGAADDDVVGVRVTGGRTPTLDWRAAARELPAAFVGSHVRAAATAAVESRLAAASPWLAGAAAALRARAEEAGGGGGGASALTAPPREEPFEWEAGEAGGWEDDA